jgi:phage terminase large subunit-like protein
MASRSKLSKEPINLPHFHAGQQEAFDASTRFFALRCGRRYGKTAMMEIMACSDVALGKTVGWFAPDYKIQSEAFREITDYLAPMITQSSKIDGIIQTATGGRIDFWTLENERAGRSRKYHSVFIDEAAFTKPNMLKVWQTAIKPALLDYQGSCMVASTPNGVEPDNFFWQVCNDPEHGFTSYHAPTHTNPFLPKEELEKLERENHPMVFRQEYLAEFVDWSGEAFFSLDKMLDDGSPVNYPEKCDGVFAVIDTAVKGGKDNDGTAVIYCAINNFFGHPLIVLDWDIIQVDGALLESWMPSVFERLEELAVATKARHGVIGSFIEDAAAGSILLQQGKSRGWKTHAIDSKLTMAGKDERAISVSGYYHQGKMKISQYAFDKVVNFKNVTRNHLITQVTGFRIGDKDAYKRADDLLDTFVYSLAIGVGNKYGY